MIHRVKRLTSLINGRMTAILFLGFASGFPYQLTNSTIQAWYTDAGVKVADIGLLGLVALPYAFKFLWAPLMDRFTLPFLGRRRGWVLVTQVLLALCLLVMACFTPQHHPMVLAILTLLFTFLAASQDINIDAYRTDVLEPEERGLASALTIGGYRVAMIISGAIALILAQEVGWHVTYCLMAVMMACCMLVTLMSPEPAAHPRPPSSLKAAVIEPFLEFLKRDQAWLLLVLLAIYKLGNAFAASLSVNFLLSGLHFSKLVVGEYGKIFGFGASIAGAFVGGLLLARLSIFRGLWYFAWLQGFAIVFYFLLALHGKSYHFMALAVAGENFFDGLGSAAFLAFNIALCDKRFSATQYALFAAIHAFTVSGLSPIAGQVAAHFSWPVYFIVSFVLSLPAIALVWHLRASLRKY